MREPKRFSLSQASGSRKSLTNFFKSWTFCCLHSSDRGFKMVRKTSQTRKVRLPSYSLTLTNSMQLSLHTVARNSSIYLTVFTTLSTSFASSTGYQRLKRLAKLTWLAQDWSSLRRQLTKNCWAIINLWELQTLLLKRLLLLRRKLWRTEQELLSRLAFIQAKSSLES